MKPTQVCKQLTRPLKPKPVSADLCAAQSSHALLDLGSLRSQRKRSASPALSPRYEATAAKLVDIEQHWKALKSEMFVSRAGSQSANVSLNDSISPNALQSQKLVAVLKAGSTPRSEMAQIQSPRSLLYKKKSGSPPHHLPKVQEEELLTKAKEIVSSVAVSGSSKKPMRDGRTSALSAHNPPIATDRHHRPPKLPYKSRAIPVNAF